MLTRIAILASMTAACAGCGQPGTITGQVTFDGKALPSGRIVFLCEGGDKPVITGQIKDGRYEITSAPAGRAVVTVATYEYKVTPVPNSPVGPTGLPGEDERGGAYVPIPIRYGDAGQSGLSLEIVGGEQTKDFHLTP